MMKARLACLAQPAGPPRASGRRAQPPRASRAVAPRRLARSCRRPGARFPPRAAIGRARAPSCENWGRKRFFRLTGSNFPRWKNSIELCLAFNEFDYALREDKPVAPVAGATGYDELKKTYDSKMEKWDKSNHVAMLRDEFFHFT
ncbi:hypothetical protein QYE76_039653 [Lolium multiflorum]|uniref:Uncharacterized protein n=1 Tax=Lolium multiflorum TaxID=4521 RepID=A0AAD8TAA4_LOLMU|nr:hypothetical protein QYE76_039653 [Lolium multiflorum]